MCRPSEDWQARLAGCMNLHADTFSGVGHPQWSSGSSAHFFSTPDPGALSIITPSGLVTRNLWEALKKT